MANLGIGVMLHHLSGGTDKSASDFYGRQVIGASVSDECLQLDFSDGTSMLLTDEGQCCCEARYITCDDNPSDLVGGVLTNIEVKESTCHDGDWEYHEMCFVEIATNLFSITICTHNEHNGYYGGFALNLSERGANNG